MASLLTYEIGNSDKIAEYIEECRHVRQADGTRGIAIRPPDVNESDETFTVVYDGGGIKGLRDSGITDTRARDLNPSIPQSLNPSISNPSPRRGAIRFGLGAINGMGHKAVQAILTARAEGGGFRDLYDFCERVDLGAISKSGIEALIKAGAFDSTGAMRRALIEAVESAIDHGSKTQRDKRAGQMDMFGGFMAAAPPPKHQAISTAEWSDAEMLTYERPRSVSTSPSTR
jgi:DNA polymerase-3 subunit alpha